MARLAAHKDAETTSLGPGHASQHAHDEPALALRPQSRSLQDSHLRHVPLADSSSASAVSADAAAAAAAATVTITQQAGRIGSFFVTASSQDIAPGSASRTQETVAPGSGSDCGPGIEPASTPTSMLAMSLRAPPPTLETLPNELLFQILGYLDVDDLLATSRVNHHLRAVAVTPILHAYRLRHNRAVLPPLLTSSHRPTLSELQSRRIFLTHTSVMSRRLARSLVSIRLSRRLAERPTAEMLVARAVLPAECIPSGGGGVAPALVARRRAVEKERVKDGLRRWVGSVWRGEVSARSERVRRREELFGVGRVWRLCRFWEAMERVR